LLSAARAAATVTRTVSPRPVPRHADKERRPSTGLAR
jgi:hypothetical protein